MLLSGSSIVSLDNITRDLEGELLCQLTERPIVRIRILGRSEMPDCECHTAVFATGNGIGFAGDMTRRGILCNLQALTERPELREFKRDTLALAANNRGGLYRGRTHDRARLSFPPRSAHLRPAGLRMQPGRRWYARL